MLDKISEYIRTNKNILEKSEISPFVSNINKNSFKSPRIFSDIGQDSAAIKNDSDMLTLITTDRIKTSYIENFPLGAGFSSILVGVDDIYACGGKPLAASIIISFKDHITGNKMIDGICKGSKLFKVPIVRGHTNIKEFNELSSTVIGEIKRDEYISATNAQDRDKIILAVDFNGKIGRASKLHWDTVTYKSSEEILNKRMAMSEIAKKKIVNSSKDLSNAGIFGTIMQLVNYSKVGALVNVNKIKIPPTLKQVGYTLETFIQMFLTTSYILTAQQDHCEEIINIFNKRGLKASIIGEIITENVLKISDGKDSIDVLNFA
ncbi:MAG: AIR synthase related protein [Promethearchaeota archaeon]